MPQTTDVSWLSEQPSEGSVPVGGAQDVTVTVDPTGLAPGTYNATVVLDTHGGRQRYVQVPVRQVVQRPNR